MTPASRPKWPWITLLALQAIQLLTLIPWLPMAGLSVMAFDSPGSTAMWQPWLFVGLLWSYPLWLLLAGIGAWVLWAFHRYVAAVVLAVLVTLPVPILLGIVLIWNH
ncbi:hypothetical protein DB345_20800 [Spartobacteria bacterium LR76]|nr:hypothetical protein DB345_20800 [Spartobacteria bacterium LR76]